MTRGLQRGSGGPVSLRISVTDRCQLRCLYCMPPGGVPRLPRRSILSFEEIVLFVRVLKSYVGLSKVRITGGEPLLRPGILELVRMLSCEGIRDLALTTNGQLLPEMASDLRHIGLRRVNVSLDSLDEGTYAELTSGGDLLVTVRGIEAALRAGLSPVKINAVVVRGYNDLEVTSLTRWALQRGCSVRFIELMPVGCARGNFENLFVPASEVRARLQKSFDLKPLVHEPGESSRDYLASDRFGRQGIIGFISPVSHPFCDGCRRLRLTSDGRLISCLARSKGPCVRELLRCHSPRLPEALTEIILKELGRKTGHRAFETLGPMVRIGG